MDKHREQMKLAREFAAMHNKEDIPANQCYQMFIQWCKTQNPQFPPMNRYKFRTVFRKPIMYKKVHKPHSNEINEK